MMVAEFEWDEGESSQMQQARRSRKGAQMEAAKHLHAKAFRLITYRSADGKLEEQIWNSRDSANCRIRARCRDSIAIRGLTDRPIRHVPLMACQIRSLAL